MPEPLIGRRALLGLNVETTKGTYSAPSGVATLEVYNLRAKMRPVMHRRAPHGGHGGSFGSKQGTRVAEISFYYFMRYGDDTESLLKSFSWEYDPSGAENDYRPTNVQASLKTLSAKVWQDGRVKPCAGLACSAFKMSADNGGPVRVDVTLVGKPYLTGSVGSYKWATAESLPSQAAFTGAANYMQRSTPLTIASFSPLVSRFEFDAGIVSSIREDVGDKTNVLHAMVVDYNPMITLDPEANLPAGRDVDDLFLNETQQALTWTPTDGTNVFSVYAPKAQHEDVDEGEREGRRTDPIRLELAASSGSDNYEIRLP